MPRLHLTGFVDVVIPSDEWSDQARCLNSIRVATPSTPSPPLLLHQLRSERPRRCRARGLDIGTLHCALASLGGSTSPRLCARKLTLMIFESVIKTFDSIAMIFDSIIMTFEPSIKIFDSIVMTFESSIKIFESIAMTFESIAMNFKGVVKKFDPCVAKKFDPCIVKKFDCAVVKKFDPAIVKKFDLYILDHGHIYAALDKAKFFLNLESIIIYFCHTRHSGAALSTLNLQVIDMRIGRVKYNPPPH
jgi:hypothetical protein